MEKKRGQREAKGYERWSTDLQGRVRLATRKVLKESGVGADRAGITLTVGAFALPERLLVAFKNKRRQRNCQERNGLGRWKTQASKSYNHSRGLDRNGKPPVEEYQNADFHDKATVKLPE